MPGVKGRRKFGHGPHNRFCLTNDLQGAGMGVARAQGDARPDGNRRRQKSATGGQRLAEDTMSAFRIALVVLVCLSAGPLFADWTYEVSSKDEAQSALVPLPLPSKAQVPEAVSVTGPDGKSFEAQVIPSG